MLVEELFCNKVKSILELVFYGILKESLDQLKKSSINIKEWDLACGNK